MTESSGLLRRLRRPADRNNDAIRSAIDGRHVDVVKLLFNDPRVNPEQLTFEEFILDL